MGTGDRPGGTCWFVSWTEDRGRYKLFPWDSWTPDCWFTNGNPFLRDTREQHPLRVFILAHWGGNKAGLWWQTLTGGFRAFHSSLAALTVCVSDISSGVAIGQLPLRPVGSGGAKGPIGRRNKSKCSSPWRDSTVVFYGLVRIGRHAGMLSDRLPVKSSCFTTFFLLYFFLTVDALWEFGQLQLMWTDDVIVFHASHWHRWTNIDSFTL